MQALKKYWRKTASYLLPETNRNWPMIFRTDNNTIGQLVMPGLVPFVNNDPQQTQTKRHQGNKVGEIPAKALHAGK